MLRVREEALVQDPKSVAPAPVSQAKGHKLGFKEQRELEGSEAEIQTAEAEVDCRIQRAKANADIAEQTCPAEPARRVSRP